MARPRIFISSTHYDLKYLRASLDVFIESLGFDSVLSEKGNISYHPDLTLDESCYQEVESVDIFVLVIGGRYGSRASSECPAVAGNYYDSITKKEYDYAAQRKIPIYVLIERSVYTEYKTFLRNRDREDITYAHVDDINVFRLIDDISSKPRNNPIQEFEKFSEIENWLRDQWAGLFRELLSKRSNEYQLSSLTSQVAQLQEVTTHCVHTWKL